MDTISYQLDPELQVIRRRLDSLYVEAGRRAHIMGRIDGSYGGFREASQEIVNPPGGGTEGIWVEPLRLLDYVHFYIWDGENGLASVERHCEQYVREVGFSRFIHTFSSHPGLLVEKRVWVPRHHAAVVISLSLKNRTDGERHVRLFTEGRSHLSLGWPRREAGNDVHRFEADLGAVLATDDSHPDWAALWGADQEPSAYHLGASQRVPLHAGDLPASNTGESGGAGPHAFLKYDLTLPAVGEARLNVVIAGGNAGADQAAEVYRHVQANADELLQERIQHYRAIMEKSVRLVSPDYTLDKAFLWAKAGTEDFKHFDPDMGLCYFAGFPAYNFYFASDTFRILYGAICTGDFEDTREILRMILKYQATEPGPDTLPGEIWHEMSTTGDRISPNFCTLDFPPLAEHFYRWTGDRAFLEEIYPNIRAAVEWGYLNDQDGDGLLENGPEGEMADSAFEDSNMERSHINPNLAWYRALKAGGRLATVLGEAGSAERWELTANELKARINQRYWNESQRSFEETIRPDGALDSSWRGVAVFDSEIVDEGKAAFGLKQLLREEARLIDPAAFASWKEAEKGYKGWREHLSWYLVARGDRARFLLDNHLTDAGVTALRHIARVPFSLATPGQFPEVIGLDDPAGPYVRGCPHQAWSGACGVLHPVVAGLFGVVPDAPSGSITIDPHLPDGWPEMSLMGLRVGENQLDITYRRRDDSLQAQLHNEGQSPLQVRLGFALPSASEILTITCDGDSLVLSDERISVRPTAEDLHVYVETKVEAGQSTTAAIEYRPADLALSAETYLERAQPGSRISIPLRLVNRGGRPISGSLQVEAPGSWPGSGTRAGRTVEVGPRKMIEAALGLEIPQDVPTGYHTLWARFEASANAVIARPIYLPVFPLVEVQLDGRGITKAGWRYPLQVNVSNLTDRAIEAGVEVQLPWAHAPQYLTGRMTIEAGETGEKTWSVQADQAGEFPLQVMVSTPDGTQRSGHQLKVLPPDRPIVLYSGFLGCPIASDQDLEIVNMPANYAVRKPRVMAQLLPLADVVLTSDQHDAQFPEQQIADLVGYVEEGGKLLLFCYWSSAWGRGFFDTYGNVAGTQLADILPLGMQRGIGQGQHVQLEGAGRTVLDEIDWDGCPPYDFNLAIARDQAEVWARSENGDPLIASRAYGRGRVIAIAIDCFGYGSYGTFLKWPGVPQLIRRTVRHLTHVTKG